MSDGPEYSSTGPLADTGQGFTITGGLPSTCEIATLYDQVPSIPGRLGITSEMLAQLSPEDKERYWVESGLLPPAEIRRSQERVNPTDPELSAYFDNISYGYNAGQVDPRFRQALSAGSSSESSPPEEATPNLQNVPPLSSIPIEERERWRATYGETHNEDGSPKSTELTAPEAVANARLAQTNPAAAAARSGAGLRTSPDPGNPYTYIFIDPFDDRYDFKTGQKVRDNCSQGINVAGSATGNSGVRGGTSGAIPPSETTNVTDPWAGYRDNPQGEFGGFDQATAEDRLMQQAVGPQRSYDPRGDQIPGSPAERAAAQQAAERRLQNLTWYRENVNSAASGYAGMDQDIDDLLQ